MKVKNLCFVGIAAAILGSAGVTSAGAVEIVTKGYVSSQVGTLEELNTSVKDNTVVAINEVAGKVGTLEGTVESLGDLVMGEDGQGGLFGDNGIIDDQGKVDGGSIKEGTVGSDQLGEGSVTTDKIEDKAVTEDKLSQELQDKLDGFEETKNKVSAADATGDKLNSDELYPSMAAAKKIADDALESAGLVGEGGIDGDNIQDGTITGDKIEDGSITGDKIGNGEIGSEQLGENSVTDVELAPDAVTEDHIKDGAVTSDKLSEELQEAIDGLVNADCGPGVNLCVLSYNGESFEWTKVADEE